MMQSSVTMTPRSSLIPFIRKAIAFIKRDMTEQMSYKVSFVLNMLGVLANILTFFFVAKLVDTGNSSAMTAYGSTYFPFVLLGIALAGYQATGLNSFSDAIIREQEAGTLEAILVTPTRLDTVIFFGSLWNFLFTSLRIGLYLAIGVIFLGVQFGTANWLTALVTVLLTITSFSGLGIFSAGFILIYKQGNPINFIITGASRLLSGVYFPLAVLPGWLQVVSACLPLTYALEAFRKALLHNANFRDVQTELTMLILFSVILIPAGLAYFRWAVQKAKMDGSLTFR